MITKVLPLAGLVMSLAASGQTPTNLGPSREAGRLYLVKEALSSRIPLDHRRYLLCLYARLDHLHVAETVAQRIMADAPGDRQTMAVMASLYIEHHQADNALQWAQAMIEHYPNDDQALYFLAVAQDRAGHSALADESFEKIKDPKYKRARYAPESRPVSAGSSLGDLSSKPESCWPRDLNDESRDAAEGMGRRQLSDLSIDASFISNPQDDENFRTGIETGQHFADFRGTLFPSSREGTVAAASEPFEGTHSAVNDEVAGIKPIPSIRATPSIWAGGTALSTPWTAAIVAAAIEDGAARASSPAQNPGIESNEAKNVPANAVVTPSEGGLTLEAALRLVVIHNESLQMKLLDAEIARRQYKAEKGIFEPAVVGSYQRVDSHRENTEEEIRQLTGVSSVPISVFDERNDLINGGLEFLSPIGSKFRIGYDVQHLRNNLNANTHPEWVTTAGLTATQPLLKNFGTDATLARIRLAAVNSDIAYQDYRRQLMLTLTRAEAAYWDLYLTEEQRRLSEDSVRIADSLFKDNKSRLEAGKSSALEVLQAEAGLALRRSRRSDASQKYSEAANQLSTLFSGVGSSTNTSIHALEHPELREVTMDYYESYRSAFDKNPDYLTKKHQALAENIRLAYAKNQLLPQLDLKGSYGLNGLGTSPSDSYDDINHAAFPAWSVGVELRIPITGGYKERNELMAAKLSKQKALVALKEIEVQVGYALNTSILKVNNLRDSAQSQASVINFHQELLETQLARLNVGLIDSRTVLETEEKLFEAKVTALDNLVQYQKALLEFELIKGNVLSNRGLELTKAELQQQTSKLLAARGFTGPEYDNLTRELAKEYNDKIHHLDAHEKHETLTQSIFK